MKFTASPELPVIAIVNIFGSIHWQYGFYYKSNFTSHFCGWKKNFEIISIQWTVNKNKLKTFITFNCARKSLSIYHIQNYNNLLTTKLNASKFKMISLVQKLNIFYRNRNFITCCQVSINHDIFLPSICFILLFLPQTFSFTFRLK